MENNLKISKQTLMQQCDNVSKPTFLKWIKELTLEKDCPFTYEQYCKGHFIKVAWKNYIIANI